MQQFEKDWETLNRGGINKQEREKKKEENDRWTDRQEIKIARNGKERRAEDEVELMNTVVIE